MKSIQYLRVKVLDKPLIPNTWENMLTEVKDDRAEQILKEYKTLYPNLEWRIKDN